MSTVSSGSRKVRDFSYLEKITNKGISKKEWASANGAAIDILIGKGPERGTRPQFGKRKSVVLPVVPWVQKIAVVEKSYPASVVTRLNNERKARLIYAFDLAKEAFGDEKLAIKFLRSKHPKLKAAPIDKLSSEWGVREIESILNAIIYGLPA